MKKAGKSLNGEKRRAECQNQKGNLRRGVGVACFSYTSNTWPVGVEIAGARLLMNQDGTISVQSGATEIGQGADTVFSQMVAETVGVPVSDVRVISTQDPMLRRSIPAHLPHARAMLPRLRCAVRHCY
ncbi:molybdopterin cofactor-binding domain-containing protein [Escherichia coli]